MQKDTKAVQSKDESVVLQDYLRKPNLMAEFQLALGPNIDAARYIRGALTTISLDRGALKSCTPQSIFKAICTAAQLRLDLSVGKGHAYLVPFYNTKLGKYEAQLIPGWKGYISKARESKVVAAIWIEAVYKDDTFHVEKGTNPRILHVPNLTSQHIGKDDSITHFYAAVKYTNQETEFEVMTKEQVDEIRADVDAKTKNGSAVWADYYGEMGRKTVFRRLSKRLQLPELETMNSLDAAVDDGRAASVTSTGEIEIRDIEPEPPEPKQILDSGKSLMACKIHADKLGWSPEDLDQYILDSTGKKWSELDDDMKASVQNNLEKQATQK